MQKCESIKAQVDFFNYNIVSKLKKNNCKLEEVNKLRRQYKIGQQNIENDQTYKDYVQNMIDYVEKKTTLSF